MRYLIKRHLRDAEVLAANRRYSGAVYLSGYAVELALKYSICHTMNFKSGFPESNIEFEDYLSGTRKPLLLNIVRKLKDIRHHDLEKLLRHSGKEFLISD